MLDNLIHFIINKFIILGVLVPLILIIKFFVYKRIKTNSTRPSDFFYFTYSNIATTHSKDRKKDKQLQNSLFIIFIFLLILQLILMIPFISSSKET